MKKIFNAHHNAISVVFSSFDRGFKLRPLSEAAKDQLLNVSFAPLKNTVTKKSAKRSTCPATLAITFKVQNFELRVKPLVCDSPATTRSASPCAFPIIPMSQGRNQPESLELF